MQQKFTLEPSGNYNRGVPQDEIIKQIESLRNFYFEMGYDTDNVKTIFSLTLSYLRGTVNKLIVKSFFEVLMQGNRLNNNKEINLLNCFEDLIDNFKHPQGQSSPDEQLGFGLQA